MSRVLVLTGDRVGVAMAGPAIRAFELARVLAGAGHKVVLATPAQGGPSHADFEILGYTAETLRGIAQGQDVILFHGWALHTHPFLTELDSCLVADVYGAFNLELLATRHFQNQDTGMTDDYTAQLVVNEQLRQSDFFLCASERQRDFWLGALASMNRVNDHTYAQDPTLRALIDVCPFGIPDEPPVRTGPAIRGRIPGIGSKDLVLYWGGGIYNWFDPLTLVRGVAAASRRHDSLRLVFGSASHPNPEVPTMRMVAEAKRLAGELGILDRHVFFNEDWIPYERRADWLLDADVGVSTHYSHVETRFAFRTRFLDYFWAGLPILCTEGDHLAEVVADEDLGLTVPPEDPAAVAKAIEVLADAAVRRRQAARSKEYGRRLAWSRVAEPLLEYCANPRPAPDLVAVAPLKRRRLPALTGYAEGPRNWRYLAVKAVETALIDGPRGFVKKSADYVRRRRANQGP